METNHIYNYDTFIGNNDSSAKLLNATKNVDVPIPEDIAQAEEEKKDIEMQIEDGAASTLSSEGHPPGVDLSDNQEETPEENANEENYTPKPHLEEKRYVMSYQRFNSEST